MNIQQLAYELRNRVELLPDVIDDLKVRADTNADGMGIHQSQINTVKAMLNKMKDEQESVIKDFAPTLPFDDFMERRNKIESFLTTTNSIMATFRYIFNQRKELPLYKQMLDIADLVAAYCYKPLMEAANVWRGLPRDYYREPPLTYLNAMLSPAAISRRHNLNRIGLKLYTDTENQLPISVISLPFHDMIAVWTFCSIYHEVGHLLDNDLGLYDELKKTLTATLKENGQNDPGSAQRQEMWETWLREMIADTFGVLLGGVGFAYSLSNMLYRTKEEMKEVGEDKHPNEHLRAYLLCALLRGTGVQPLIDDAQKIEKAWHDTYGDIASLAPYIAECNVVADILLKTKLDALKNAGVANSASHALVEFGYKLAANHEKIESLATWLRDEVSRPDYTTYPYQLVPAAAQMAVEGVTDKFEETYKAIEQRALEFIALIPHENFLAPFNKPARQAYLKNMVAGLNFTAVKTASP